MDDSQVRARSRRRQPVLLKETPPVGGVEGVVFVDGRSRHRADDTC
jgi:hypothetical protein